MALLATTNAALPSPDRATLRRFRHLVADLGTDFYLATVDERIAGVAHITYARQLADRPIATLATLIVAPGEQHDGISSALLRFAVERARKRACSGLRCAVRDDRDPDAAEFLTHAGAAAAGRLFELPLPEAATGEPLEA